MRRRPPSTRRSGRREVVSLGQVNSLVLIESVVYGNRQIVERAAHHGLRTILLTSDPSLYPDTAGMEVVTLDTSDVTAYLDSLADAPGIKAPKSILSPTDTWGVAAAEQRERLGLYCPFSAAELRRFRDKAWVRAQLPETQTGYPRIVKPASGTGSQGIYLVANEEEEVRARTQLCSGALSEPYFRGPLYSAEVYRSRERFIFFGVTNRTLTKPPRFLEEAKTFPHAAGTPWEDDVRIWAEATLGALSYACGFAHVEFIETVHGFALVELNPRMGGALITAAVDACTTYDPYAMLVDEALGLPLEVPATRKVTQAASHVSIYADAPGTLEAVEGTQELRHFPGNVRWLPTKAPGDEIADAETYRARVGNVWATAPLAELAQDRALAAANSLDVEVTPPGTAGT